MTPAEFIKKWKPVALTERAAAHTHFLDLCKLFEHGRILPKDAQAAVMLKTRTLTNLYNQRPQWLVDAHRDLEAAVAAAYGWPADISEEDALAKLLELNLVRAAATLEPGLIEESDDED
jgi:hypothetical protein